MLPNPISSKSDLDKSAILTLDARGQHLSGRHIEIFFSYFFFPENRFWLVMQVVSITENLHEMSNPVVWKNKMESVTTKRQNLISRNIINLSAALAKRVIKVTDNLPAAWETDRLS